jgi:hypothetical protein
VSSIVGRRTERVFVGPTFTATRHMTVATSAVPISGNYAARLTPAEYPERVVTGAYVRDK